eukprot:5640897-Alexandrium_andersonii.AAC.1
MAPTFIHTALEGCPVHRFSCTCRACQRSRPAGAPEALLGGAGVGPCARPGGAPSTGKPCDSD